MGSSRWAAAARRLRSADRGVTRFALEIDDVDVLCERIAAAGLHANTKPLDLGSHKTTYVRGPDNEIIEIREDRADYR